MVPRDQFNRMAALALVAILLLLVFSCRAYAAEIVFIDSGPPPEQRQEEIPEIGEDEHPQNFPWFEIPDYGEWIDSGDPSEYDLLKDNGEDPSSELQDADLGTLLKEITQIRQMLELILCFILPFTLALWLVYKFCMWFYYTFIRTVL